MENDGREAGVLWLEAVQLRVRIRKVIYSRTGR